MATSQEIDQSLSLNRVVSHLNDYGVKYRVCQFSPSHPREEIEQEGSRLGLGLIEAVPLDVGGQGIALAIIPASLMVHLAELSRLVAPRQIRSLAHHEVRQRLLLTNSAETIPPLAGLLGVESLLSPLIEQHRTIGFFVGSENTLITLDAAEFRRLSRTASPIPVPTRAKYRAYASPGRKAHEHSILGVSLDNSDFRTSKLITITEWIRNHYAHCVVMLGDGMNRITLQLDSHLPESDALEHSKWLARDFVHSEFSVFNHQESRCRFDFVFSSEIQTTERYVHYYRQLSALYEEHPALQSSFRAFSLEFLARRPSRQADAAEHMDMSCRYLLEELAVMSCLAQDVPCTFVYPGSLTILQEIAKGKHPYLPTWLQQIDYVELKLKGRQTKHIKG